jgi:hypothetical protein
MLTKCQRCGSAEVLPIAYGLPSRKLVGAAVAGRVVLGGRAVWTEAPNWLCVQCGHDWRDEDLPRVFRDR